MTDTPCRLCLGHWSDCSALRLFNGRSCCGECDHNDRHPGRPGDQEASA